jgi:type III secretion protein C
MNLRNVLSHIAHWIAVIAVALVLSLSNPSFAAGTPWPDAPYSYFANNARLDTVLADFASGFSLSLSVQPDVAGTVNGRFSTNSPTEFLNKLAGVYGFVWYTHAGTLFVSRSSDVVTRGLAAPGGNIANLRKAMTDLGVLEPRFGWGELADQGMAIVSGPPSYVHLLENTLKNLPARSQQLMVFRLQHASAIDRRVNYRDQTVVTPGVASVLRSMIGGALAVAPGDAPAAGVGGGLGAPLPSSGVSTTTPNPPAAAATPPAPATNPSPAASTGSAPAAGPRPQIQADARLNAVIIQDVPERMPLYREVIAQLDVPTPLVEIEAMIVDISTDRASELGVDWSGRVGRTTLDFTATDGATLGFSSASTAAGNFLISHIRALENKGDAEIHSKPSVLTSENLAAVLDLSTTFYIRTTGERVATVTPVTAGTTLKVNPHVVQQGDKTFVQLRIDIEDGQVTDTTVDALPTVTRTTVSTEATVLNGEALLIAGYSNDLKSVKRTQVPVLGDIPIAGALFATNTASLQKRERMFLIRPKVVGLPGQAMAHVDGSAQ